MAKNHKEVFELLRAASGKTLNPRLCSHKEINSANNGGHWEANLSPVEPQMRLLSRPLPGLEPETLKERTQ